MRKTPEIGLPEDEKRFFSAAEPVYTLEALLEGVTQENRHAEMDWGPSVGNAFPASEIAVISESRSGLL